MKPVPNIVAGASSSRSRKREQDAPATRTPKLRFPEFRKAPGWATKPGDELFEQISNREAPPGLPILAITQEQGAVPRDTIDYHVSVTDKSVEAYKEVLPGDFIISLRSFQGGIEYSEFHGICSPAYVILRKRTDLADLFYKHLFKSHRFIQELTKNLEGLRDGKMVSYKQFSELLLPAPSLPEQRKIAACLASLDDLIVAESQKLDALKAHKKGLMQQLFPREGETRPRLRFPEFRKAGEWGKSKIGDSCESYSGGTPSTVQKEFYGGNIPFIRSAEIGKPVTELFLTELGLKSSAAKLVNKGDVLVALYGANSGEVALAKIAGAINQAILCLKPDGDRAFLYHYLSLKKDWIVTTYIQGGQGNLSGEIVKSIELCFPATSEQHRIASCLSSLDDLITSQAAKLEALKTHKKGLMQQLFPAPEENS